MWEKLKGAAGFVAGLAVLVVILALLGLLVDGGAWLAAKVNPVLSVLASIAFVVSLIVLLPLSFIRRTRTLAASGLNIAAVVIGVALWVWALLLVYSIWGAVGVIVGVLLAGFGVVPVAMLATLLHGEWSNLIQLIIVAAVVVAFAVYAGHVSRKAMIGMR